MIEYPPTLYEWIGIVLFHDWLHLGTFGTLSLVIVGWQLRKLADHAHDRRQPRFSWRCFRCGAVLENLSPSQVTDAALGHHRKEHM